MKSVIRDAQEESSDDLSTVREPFLGVPAVGERERNAEFAVSFDIASMLDGDMQTLEKLLASHRVAHARHIRGSRRRDRLSQALATRHRRDQAYVRPPRRLGRLICEVRNEGGTE